MMGVAAGTVAAGQSQWVKRATYSGKGPDGAGAVIVQVNSLTRDEWYPQTGLPGDHKFTVPLGGNYSAYAQVSWPHYTAGPGWSNGYSGNGSGSTWIRHTRGGATVTDNIALQSYTLADAADYNTKTLGPVNINSMLAGDKIEVWGDNGATGYDPFQWDVTIEVIKRKA